MKHHIRIEDIEGIQAALDRVEAAIAERKHLLTPSDTDDRKLLVSYRELFGEGDNHEHSRIFLFVYLYLYDRGVLFGATPRLRKNIRKRLNHLLGLTSPTLVSARIRDLMFYFKTYPKFRTMVNLLYEKFLEKNA